MNVGYLSPIYFKSSSVTNSFPTNCSSFLSSRTARISKSTASDQNCIQFNLYIPHPNIKLGALFSRCLLDLGSPIRLLSSSSSMIPTAGLGFPADRNPPMLTRADPNPTALQAQTSAPAIWFPGEVYIQIQQHATLAVSWSGKSTNNATGKSKIRSVINKGKSCS